MKKNVKIYYYLYYTDFILYLTITVMSDFLCQYAGYILANIRCFRLIKL